MSTANRRTDQVTEALALDILSGELEIGSKMPSDDSLCARFNVSRTILREAFRLLSAKGLLQARPRIGTLVADKANWALWDKDLLHWRDKAGHSAQLIADIDDIRLALEPSLAALAASRGSDIANQNLQQALRDLETARADIPIYEACFLTALYHAAGNEMAAAAVHLAQWAIAHRATPIPLAAYRRMTAAIAQKQPSDARQAAIQALLNA